MQPLYKTWIFYLFLTIEKNENARSNFLAKNRGLFGPGIWNGGYSTVRVKLPISRRNYSPLTDAESLAEFFCPVIRSCPL